MKRTDGQVRWEHGSEYHWVDFEISDDIAKYPWGDNALYLGSGRDALRLVLKQGMKERGWRRLWLPSYFCPEVSASIIQTGIDVFTYSDSPLEKEIEFRNYKFEHGDVLLIMNYFGLRPQPSYINIDRNIVDIIEDHTHDLCSNWAWNSEADWCIASLRKTLPLPDGGVLWSPLLRPLPSLGISIRSERTIASLEKFTAMVLKRLFLQGYPLSKDTFRRLAIKGEEHIAAGEISAMQEWTKSLLFVFPVQAWREKRYHNCNTLAKALANVSEVKVLVPEEGLYPFAGILIFDTCERCAYIRERLIQASVYPAVLWPLNTSTVSGIPLEHKKLSRRMLSIHCDMRYDDVDMEYVASLIKLFGEEFK